MEDKLKIKIKHVSEELLTALYEAFPNVHKFSTGEVLTASPQEILVCEIEERITDLLGQIKSV